MECPTCKGMIVSGFWPYDEKVCSSCGIVLSEPSIAKGTFFTKWNPQWHSNWNEDDSETLKQWLTTLRIVASQLDLPEIPYKEEAARRIRKEKHVLSQSRRFGKHKRATVAALLHLVLKQYGKNRSIQEICKQLSLDSRLVIKQAWNLNKTSIENQKKKLEATRKTSIDYLFEYGGRVTSDTKLLVETKNTLVEIRRRGGNPIALAAGALYYMCKKKKLKVSKKRIAAAFGISHRTVYSNEAHIRTRLKQMSKQKTDFALSPKKMLLTAK